MLTASAVAFTALAIFIGIIGKSGLEVDGRRYAWRNYFRILGITFGRWQNLPPITGITLKYFSILASTSSTTVGDIANWNNTNRKNEQLVLLLSVSGSNQGIVLRSASLTELMAVRALAEEISRELSVPVKEFLPTGTKA